MDDELVLEDDVVVLCFGCTRASGGSAKSSTSAPSIATDMYRCQIWAGRPPPVTPSIGWDRDTHPDHGGVARDVAGEPRVDVVLRGAGLAGRRPTDVGGPSRARLDHAAQRLGDVQGHVGSTRLLWAGRPVVLPHDVAVAVLDLRDGVGLHPGAVVGEGEVGAGQVGWD
jgi:hypothetical protein